MSILSWLGRSIRLTDRSFWSAFYGGETWAGEPINPETAMQIAAFWACVRLVAQTIGSLPLGLYRHQPDGSRVAVLPDNDLYKLVHEAPSAEHTAVEFWEGIGTCLCLAGNAFVEKFSRGTGASRQVVAMDLLNPAFVSLRRRTDGSIFYSYADPVRGARDISEENMFHIRGFGMGGDLGFSPINFARQSLSANRATEHSAASHFANGMRPSGWIVYKGARVLTPAQREEAKKNLIDPMTGAGSSGKTGLLEGDFDYRQMTIPPEDAQLLETRAFGVEEVCRVFGVPPVLVGHAQAGQTMWGCLPASTLVLTSTGPRSIAAVAVGDTVWTLDGDRMVQRRVLRSGQTGTLPLYTIRTRSRTVRATGNHKFLVRRKYAAPRPGRAIEWRNEWIEASQLTPADYLVAAHGLVGETGETIAPNGRALTDDFMEACGLYVADGVSLPHTATEILALGFEEAAHLPGWLYGLTRPLLLAFLRGYLDGDGHVSKAGWITWSSANPDLLEDVRALCIVAGYPSAMLAIIRCRRRRAQSGRRGRLASSTTGRSDHAIREAASVLRPRQRPAGSGSSTRIISVVAPLARDPVRVSRSRAPCWRGCSGSRAPSLPCRCSILKSRARTISSLTGLSFTTPASSRW